MPNPKNPRRRGAEPVPAAKLDAFFTVLAETGSVSTAAEKVGLQRSTVYQLRRRNKAFAARWDEALDMGLDRLQDDAMTRATVGVERPVFRNGRKIASVQQFDNRLLQFLLKAHRPETYSDRPRAVAQAESFELAKRLKAAQKRLDAHRARQRAQAAEREKSGSTCKREGDGSSG